MFEQHIKVMEDKNLPIPDFPSGLTWFNSKPLSFHNNLKGKIVILDFWTYCCINCIHVLPELAHLEKKYANDPVAFIGVHSAKFDNERDNENIRRAILRYDIEHPVVNDPEMTLWEKLGVHSWPTIVVVGPHGSLLLSLSGEGNRETLDEFISEALNYYSTEDFNKQPLPIELEKNKIPPNLTLRFPGKLAIDADNKRLFISDSNHHRIVVTSLEGRILEIIGSGNPGFEDGSFQKAQFNRLQGLAYHQHALYVADAENHAIRMVNFETHTVSTLVGTGQQGRDYRGGNTGKKQPISTPWDLVLSHDKQRLYIAMAGTHQIWECDLHTSAARAFSGSGAEMNLNSDSLMHAAWAQPSGITLVHDFLYIADSESSSIRDIDLKNRVTHTLAGGDSQNPRNLFCFGDNDGIGDAARFQHPLGVIWLEKEQVILVADTYNHRIKALDPKTRKVTTWAGSGKPGSKDGIGTSAQFYEPSGFAISPEGDKVFIADTNNHLIRILDVKTKQVSTLKLI